MSDEFLPYDGKGTQFKVEKNINFPQLAAELTKALPNDVAFVGTRTSIDNDEVNEKNPMVLHFSSADVNHALVKSVVDEHEPDPHFGLSEDEVAHADLISQLEKGDLSLKDLNALLRNHLALFYKR